MLKRSLKLCTTPAKILSPFSRYQMSSASSATKQKWDLWSAVCVERHPLITTSKNQIEEEYEKMINEIEVENSMKSDYELKVEVEVKNRELLQQGKIQIDVDQASTVSAQELQDVGDEELAAHKFGPRITQADRSNVTSSLDRKLDKSLLLLVQQKIGNDSFWLPPQGIRRENENMRQTAERVLLDMCGDKLVAKIYGNAPMGFYKWLYPKSIRNEGSTQGAKVFYYLAKYINGGVADTVQYQWLDRPELEKNLPKLIYKSMSQFLIPEQTN